MRVFILTTGRSGSTTFFRACTHIQNYTAAHEQKNYLAELRYPDNHIEVNNRLVWFLPILTARYPEAHYCWLYRDPAQTAQSYLRWAAQHGDHPGQLFHAYRQALKQGAVRRRPIDDARDMVDLINATIFEHALRCKRFSRVRLDHAEVDFQRFWEAIHAEGDLSAALQKFQTKHNASSCGLLTRLRPCSAPS